MLPPCVTRMNYNDFNEQFDNNYNRCLSVVLFFIREKSFWKVQMILGEIFWPNVSWEDVGIHEISWTLENAVQEKTVYQKNSGSINGGNKSTENKLCTWYRVYHLKNYKSERPLLWIGEFSTICFYSQNSTFQYWNFSL